MASNGNINFLHHIGLFVSDYEATLKRYQHLGFQLAPASDVKFALEQGKAPVAIGCGKRDAILKHGFLEIVGITDPDAWAQTPAAIRERFDVDSKVSLYSGIHVMFFGTSDIEAVHARLTAAKLPASQLGSMSRNVSRPDGEQTLTAKFIHTDPVLFAQFANPEALFYAPFMVHPNSASDLIGCVVCVDNAEDRANVYARYTGHEAEKRGNLYVLDLGYSRVVVVSPEHVDDILPGYKPPSLPAYAGFIVSTETLHKTREFLTRQKVPFRDERGSLTIAAEDACGSAIIFEEI